MKTERAQRMSKVIIRINSFSSTKEDREFVKKYVVDSLNECGVAVVPSFCDIFVIEDDRKDSEND